MKAGARFGHAILIRTLEKEILSPDTHPYTQVWFKPRYIIALNNWRVTEGVELQPLPCAYWSASEKAEFNTTNYVGWSAIEPISNNDVPEQLFFSNQGKAAGILPDGTILFGFASSEANKTNDHKRIIFNLASDAVNIDFYATRTNGILDAHYNITSAPSWKGGEIQYSLINPATNQFLSSDLEGQRPR